jgi:uncharacterized membrane protein YqaE (UPF0057 family)
MRYLLALVFPPLAVAISGRPKDLATSVLLTLLLWLPGVLHALMVVSRHYEGQDTFSARTISHSGAAE